MRKSDLIKEISLKTGIERLHTEAVTEAFMHCVKESISSNESVFLRGFGTFMVKKRAPKLARNISKGTFMSLPEHFVPAFKPSKEFSKKVRARLGSGDKE
jgi:DNA-binding protein HU-beta